MDDTDREGDEFKMQREFCGADRILTVGTKLNKFGNYRA